MSTQAGNPPKKTTIGGQAIIEGIVMKGPRKSCTVVRKPDGELVIEEKDTPPIAEKYKILGAPLIRGAVMLFAAMKDGMEAINFSAQFFEEEENPSKFEQWLESKVGSKNLEKLLLGIGSAFGVIIPLLLFFFLPTLLTSFLGQDTPQVLRNLAEGTVRIVIFLLFMWVISHMKDIQRTFSYHGAEHKTIFCYEAGQALTVENVRKQERFHPRCGTSFLFVVIIISILVSSVVFSLLPPLTPLYRIVGHLLLLPIVVGLSYEINRFAGRHDNLLTHLLRWPGLRLQRLTVFEPDDSMIEVAISAMEHVIPTDDSDAW